MQGFWTNISRYPRYFITIILGVFLNTIAPFSSLLKRPTTAIALMGVLISGLIFIGLTLKAMLGFNPA